MEPRCSTCRLLDRGQTFRILPNVRLTQQALLMTQGSGSLWFRGFVIRKDTGLIPIDWLEKPVGEALKSLTFPLTPAAQTTF